jgi:membrane-associated phospholipid phosphatase
MHSLLLLLSGRAKRFTERPVDELRKKLVYVILVNLIACGCLAILAATTDPSALETGLFHNVNDLPANLRGLFGLLSLAGSVSTAFIGWLALAYLLAGRRATVVVSIAGITSWLAALWLKTVVGRPRPEALLDMAHIYGKHYSDAGFPSGHATFAAACATIIIIYGHRRYRPWLAGVAGLVGLSRMYLGAHFPLDVLGGWTLGIAIAAIFCLLAEWYSPISAPKQSS